MENHGNVSKAMIQAGYSPATAKNPKNLTMSKGWQELMEEQLPDAKLLKKHNSLLNAPSKRVQLGALDLAYDIKNKKKTHVGNATQINIYNLPPEEQQKINEVLEDNE